MKKGIIISGIVGMLCLVQQVGAADSDRSADHDALRTLRVSVEEGLNAQDVDMVIPFLAKTFVYSGIDQTVITTKDELKAYFTKVFKAADAPVQSMKIEVKPEILTRFIAENVGICYGTAKETYTMKNGQEVVLNSRWTATCIKEDETWKVSAFQSGVNALDNSILRNTARFWRNCTVGGVLAGLIVGFVLSSIARKKRSA